MEKLSIEIINGLLFILLDNKICLSAELRDKINFYINSFNGLPTLEDEFEQFKALHKFSVLYEKAWEKISPLLN